MTQHTLDNQNFLITEQQNHQNVSTSRSKKQRRTLWQYLGAGAVAASLCVGAFAFTLDSQASRPETPASTTHVATHSTMTTQKDVLSNGLNSMKSEQAIKMAPVSAKAQGSYVDIARQAAASYGLNPDLFVRQIQQESGFNPNARSWVGATGIAQFMPGTAAAYGVNPYDPVDSLYGAAHLMSDLNNQFGGDYAKALAGYNAGPGNVYYAVNAGGSNWRAFLPGETQHYISVIMG